jgi:uncharacterized protein (UPF0548 family)
MGPKTQKQTPKTQKAAGINSDAQASQGVRSLSPSLGVGEGQASRRSFASTAAAKPAR